MKSPDISVLILTCDRPTELAATLHDLTKQSRKINELIVVNNSRLEEPTLSVVADQGRLTSSQVVYLRGSPVFGTASGRNAGLDESTGDIVFLFDDDLRFPTRDYLELVCKVFEDDRVGSIGAVTTPAAPPDAHVWSVRVRLQARRLAKLLFGIDSLRPGTVTRSGIQATLPVVTRADMDWLQGGVSAIRRDVADRVRFDEGLERVPLALSEDVEFGLQVRRRWRIRFLGTTFAVNGHVRRGTVTQWLDDEARYELIARNYDRINRRHRPGTINRLAFWWAMTGIGIERIAAIAFRQPRARQAWQGYVRGIRAVLAGDDCVDQPIRTVERIVLGDTSNPA
jgi:GT2 family glycosyltransferase